MTMELTHELAAALKSSGDGCLEFVDPQTRRTYVLVEIETHHRAMQALDRQQSQAAIAEGLAQMQVGEGKPIDEAFSDLREKLGFPSVR